MYMAVGIREFQLEPIYRYPTTTWTRSADGLVAGVCTGLARRFGVETWAVRFIWVMAVLFFGAGLLVYFVLAVCLPREDQVPRAYRRMLLGVCSRLARRTDIEIGLVRVAAIALAGTTLGAAVVGYVVLYFLLPEPDAPQPGYPGQPPYARDTGWRAFDPDQQNDHDRDRLGQPRSDHTQRSPKPFR